MIGLAIVTMIGCFVIVICGMTPKNNIHIGKRPTTPRPDPKPWRVK